MRRQRTGGGDMEDYRPALNDLATGDSTRQKCGNCIFFAAELANGVGACRVNAPQVVGDGVALQPQVAVEAWCGQWAERPPELGGTNSEI